MEAADTEKVKRTIWRPLDQGTAVSVRLGDVERQPVNAKRQTLNGDDEWIEIVDLEVKSKIGVPEKERESFQKLLVCIRFQIEAGFRELHDRLDKTIDYAAVATEAVRVAEENRARLLETLVSAIADTLMARFRIRHLEVELKKFILPNTRYVGVKSIRTRG